MKQQRKEKDETTKKKKNSHPYISENLNMLREIHHLGIERVWGLVIEYFLTASVNQGKQKFEARIEKRY